MSWKRTTWHELALRWRLGHSHQLLIPDSGSADSNFILIHSKGFHRRHHQLLVITINHWSCHHVSYSIICNSFPFIASFFGWKINYIPAIMHATISWWFWSWWSVKNDLIFRLGIRRRRRRRWRVEERRLHLILPLKMRDMISWSWITWL